MDMRCRPRGVTWIQDLECQPQCLPHDHTSKSTSYLKFRLTVVPRNVLSIQTQPVFSVVWSGLRVSYTPDHPEHVGCNV